MVFFVHFARVGKRKVKSKFRRRRSVRVCKDMSRISGLPDELLIKILSFLPTKVAVSTSILSKQWKFLWMWLPKLEYVSKCYSESKCERLRCFLDRNLPLHRAPVMESLRFKLSGKQTKPEDIKRWIEIAVSRYVRQLKLSYFSENQNIFPSSFYTCESLVILELSGVTLMFMDVSSMVCLPSLKTLKLKYVTLMDIPSMVSLPSLQTLKLDTVTYVSDGSFQRLLSICPVLEDLSVHFCGDDDDMEELTMKEFTIIVPTLQSLSLYIPYDLFLDGYVVDTPCLKYFKLEDWSNVGHYSEFKNMPKLREAYVDVVPSNLKSVVGSITSVKRLTLCSEILNTDEQDDVYGDGFVFNELEHLNLCVCKKHSPTLLTQLLNDSPILRVLEISSLEDHESGKRNHFVSWKQPSLVPECLLSSLQVFKWPRYFGKQQDRDIAVYILKNACCLKTATILAQPCLVPKLDMLKELAFSSRASTTCELVFH